MLSFPIPRTPFKGSASYAEILSSVDIRELGVSLDCTLATGLGPIIFLPLALPSFDEISESVLSSLASCERLHHSAALVIIAS